MTGKVTLLALTLVDTNKPLLLSREIPAQGSAPADLGLVRLGRPSTTLVHELIDGAPGDQPFPAKVERLQPPAGQKRPDSVGAAVQKVGGLRNGQGLATRLRFDGDARATAVAA